MFFHPPFLLFLPPYEAKPVGRKFADLHRNRLLEFILINTLEKPLGLLFLIGRLAGPLFATRKSVFNDSQVRFDDSQVRFLRLAGPLLGGWIILNSWKPIGCYLSVR
jgi:hypothetical protein